MKTITVYDKSTGLVLKVMTGWPETLMANIMDGQSYVEGSFHSDQYYFDDGMPTLFPPKTSRLHRWDCDLKEWVVCEVETASAWQEFRAERDRRLGESDRYILPDYPISQEIRDAWLAYCQALRELPELATDPTNPDLPIAPSAN